LSDQRERLQAALAGHYTIDRELGHGGMAIVYLALDTRHDRQVALKVLRPEIAAALGAERFLREIRIAAGLSHPNILPLYDSGEAGGILYYVMPYVEGESLRDRLNREGPMPLAEALAIATETADALMRSGTYVSPAVIASVYVGLGDKDQALDWLERAIDDRTWSMFLLRVEPMLDPLRGDPRFPRLIQRVGLP
jgi:serine/threonine protein kinase